MNSSKVAEGKTNTSSGGGSYFSTIFGSSLDHYHQPAAATTSSSVGAKPKNEMNPNDIPPDELLQLCMKLNKRMQTLETKHNELIQKYKVVHQEKISLFDLLKSSIDNPPDSLEDISALQEVWTHQQEEEKVHIRKLEEEIKSLKLSQTDHSHSESSQSPVDLEQQSSQLQRALQELQEAHLEVHKAHQIEKNLRNSISNLELTSLEKNQRIEELEKLFEAEKAAREEDLVFFRLQQMKSDKGAVVDDVKTVAELSEAKQKILLQEGELEERRQRIESLLEQTRQYEKRMLTLESDANRYKEKLKEFEKNSGATTLLKAEQEALLNSLRRELKNALSAKEDLARHVKDLEAYRGRAEGQLVKLVEYKEKALAVEENLIEAQALNSRLQSQLQTVETNHALKTAMLATVEAEIESLKDLNLKSKQEYEKKLGILESKHRELRESNERVSVVVQEKEAIINSLRQEILVLNESHLNEMRVSQETHSKEVQDLMRESSKKSATAATLISEREKEIADLRSKVSSLKDEIASGSPSERKIFELAQSQANREATIGASIDSRDIAFQQLQNALASKDLELARLQQSHVQLVAEITELRRVSKREGVNMDYLKNIVLQYMSFPPASPERNSLVPVLALLLQFSPTELKTAEEASRSPSWTPRPVKEVKISVRNGEKSSSKPLEETQPPIPLPRLQFNEV